MHHRTIRASKSGNLSGVRCGKLAKAVPRARTLGSPHRCEWTSGNSQEQIRWELSRRRGKRKWERVAKGTRREEPARGVNIHLSTSQPGEVGGLNTEADASTMWLSAAIGRTMPQNRRPCLRFNFLTNRLTMCVSERPCCGHISAPEIKIPCRESTTRWPSILG